MTTACRDRKLPSFLSALLLAVCLSPCLSAAAMVSAGSASVLTGNTFAIPARVDGVTDLYAYQFDLAFDPGILRLDSIAEGPFLPAAGPSIFIPGAIDNMAGTATFTADSLSGPIPGASGTGVLAVFSFTALSAGRTLLVPSNTILLDSNLNDIPHSTADGDVLVLVSPVPEPATLMLTAITLIGWLLAAARTRR